MKHPGLAVPEAASALRATARPVDQGRAIAKRRRGSKESSPALQCWATLICPFLLRPSGYGGQAGTIFFPGKASRIVKLTHIRVRRTPYLPVVLSGISLIVSLFSP
jgi:hypothetical protein